ncbi:hypothetical protein GCM10009415_39410 [Chitinophaga japonensis]
MLCGILFSGCTKEYNEYVTPNQTIFADIAPGDWQLIGNNAYGYTIAMPEIDNYVNDNFGIVVSISGGTGTYEAIPEVYDGYSYSYTHTSGSLTIETQTVDGTPGNPPEDPIFVKIVLVESQP